MCIRDRGVTPPDVEGLLRELAPQALGAVARRYGEFADAEDAVQEALVTGRRAVAGGAARQTPVMADHGGLPPAGRRVPPHGCPPTARGARRLALDPPGTDGARGGRLAGDAAVSYTHL